MNRSTSPIHRLDLDGADHLTTVLMRAFAIGNSLDSLDPQRGQLQSLGPSLECLFQDLGREIATLSDTSDGPRSGQGSLHQTLLRLSAHVAALIEAARVSAL